MTMRKQLAIGSIWTAGVRAGISVMGLANTVILARLLTPEDFGLVAVAAVFYAIVGAFTGLSMAAALIQHKAPQREHYDSALTIELLRGALVAAVMGMIGLYFAFYGDPRIALILYAYAVVAIVGAVRNPKLIEFQRRLSFRQDLFIQFAEKLAGIIVAVAIALIYQSFWAIVAGWVASQVIAVVLSYVLIPYLPRFSLQHWRTLFAFSSWVALGSGVREINWRADKLMVNAVLGPSMLGQYEVGGRLSALPVRESMAPLVYVLFPAFAKLQEQPVRLQNAYVRAQRILAMVAFPVGIGFALVAAPLVEFALGPDWAIAGLVIQVLSSLFALQAIVTPFAPMAMGLGRTRLLFIRDLINLVVRFPILVIGFFLGGLVGLLAARCVSTVFIIGQDLFLARRLTGATFVEQIFSSWRAGVASLGMVAVVLGLQMLGITNPTILDLAVLVLTGGVTYAVLTSALWLLAGKPEGPEQEVVDLVQSFLPKSKHA